MSIVKTNALPAPTFRWLNVNDKEIDIAPDELTPHSLALRDGKTTRIDIKESTQLFVNANDNTFASLILFLEGGSDTRLGIDMNVGSGSDIKVVEVFKDPPKTLAGIRCNVEDSSTLSIVQLYLGSTDTASEIDVTLSGYKSKLVTDIGYLLNDDGKLDINLIARHSGKKTESEINVKGVMNDQSEKIFKGTIDFLCGASGAKGSEKEDVMLLGDKVVNKTVPLILCAEEDVEGEHGASIGRIDDSIMFYMRSRGIDEQTIYDLLARSKISSVIEKIGDEQTTARLDKNLLWGDEVE